jgi:hypothetical protein
MIARLSDFRELRIFGRSEKKFSSALDKGHRQEIEFFCDALRNGEPAPVSFDELYASMMATFRVLESVALNGKEVVI